ncbi:septum site-determining protein MinC [Desulfolucanica intricata]|uniref:septum site-determining protein MinC n=1 Tax=Desulfolucanica intricata TaxID=1285191 RepID=UPI00082B328E|nr:septum site-determining protein MinC [Desulfolucanica intricata]
MHKESVSIKGTKNGLLILYNPTNGFENIKQTLTHKLDSAQGFFEGARFSLIPTAQSQKITEKQKSELEGVCQMFGLIPSENQETIHNLAVEKIVNKAQLAKHSQAPPINPPGEPTLLVQKNLRSGQKLSYPGHIVILGNINHGAEITAEGNIVVLGSCYGLIHAGYPNNHQAKVIATFLDPTHLSIAGINYSGSSNHAPDVPNAPQIAFIKNQKVIVQEYLISKQLQAQ